MTEPKKHTRIPLGELRESPANGVYLTRQELRTYRLLTGALVSLLTLLAVFRRKG